MKINLLLLAIIALLVLVAVATALQPVELPDGIEAGDCVPTANQVYLVMDNPAMNTGYPAFVGSNVNDRECKFAYTGRWTLLMNSNEYPEVQVSGVDGSPHTYVDRSTYK